MKHSDTAIILAGGKSTRMGSDKQFLTIGGLSLVDHLAEKLIPLFQQLIVVSNCPEGYSDKPYAVVSDAIEGLGPLAGIHAGLQVTRSRYNYVLACDMPNVNLDYISYMRGLLPTPPEEIDALITSWGAHIEPFNAFYSRSLLPDIAELPSDGNKSLAAFLRGKKTILIDEAKARLYSPDWSMFANLNTPEDFFRCQGESFHKLTMKVVTYNG